MENNLIVLPEKVAQIAKNVSVEKRNEVQTVLNHVFNGVAKMREQLENISVKDQNDEVSMKLAGTIRLAVKRERLDAEKKFDAKRAEVKQEMLSYKTLDSLYLKAKQIMQIQTKELEEIALFKEETKERFEKEQKELKVQQQILKVTKVAPEMSRSEFENMSDASFEIFFSGIEKQYNDRIEAEKKAEADRLAAIEADRLERERIKAENERLQKEAEAKEKQLAAERAKAEADKKAIEEKARKEREESERILLAERKLAAEKLEIEMANARKMAAEIEAKKQADEKARKEAELKAEADRKAKADAEKKAKNATDKEKLIKLALEIDAINLPDVKGNEALKIVSDVKILLSKVSGFINENTKKL